MDERQRLLQRARDGVLGQAENAALQAMLSADSALAGHEGALTELDILLRREAAPRRQRPAEAHIAAVMQGISAHAPATSWHLRVGDVVMAATLISLIVVTYGIMGTMLNRSAMLVALAGVSLVAGCGLMAFAGALRGDLPLLGALLRQRMHLGNGEVLVYRAVGCAIAIGGVWLSWLG